MPSRLITQSCILFTRCIKIYECATSPSALFCEQGRDGVPCILVYNYIERLNNYRSIQIMCIPSDKKKINQNMNVKENWSALSKNARQNVFRQIESIHIFVLTTDEQNKERRNNCQNFSRLNINQ